MKRRIRRIEVRVFWNDWNWNLGKSFHPLRFIEIGPFMWTVEYE